MAGKEWIEVQVGSHRAVITDFRSAEADGKTIWKGHHDRGHHAEVTAFQEATSGGQAMPTDTMLASMRATIEAAIGARKVG